MELEHLIFPHGHKVAPIPPPKMLLKLLDGPDREVRLGDVHDVVPVPAGLKQLPRVFNHALLGGEVERGVARTAARVKREDDIARTVILLDSPEPRRDARRAPWAGSYAWRGGARAGPAAVLPVPWVVLVRR